ncbi:MAG: hypothetical protein ACLFWR_14240 [Acidimicrobiales bacterium]
MSDEVTRDEKEALAEKLETFMSGLSDREADLFAAILRPPDQLDEVSGFSSSFDSSSAQLIDMKLGDVEIGSGYRRHVMPVDTRLHDGPHPIWGK